MLGDEVPKLLTPVQITVLLHEIALRIPIPEGVDSTSHVAPESVVPITTGVRKILNPAAVQSDAVGQEIAFRPSTS
jgi:hypothetical protein